MGRDGPFFFSMFKPKCQVSLYNIHSFQFNKHIKKTEVAQIIKSQRAY